jgi:hypothetical protein
VRRVVELGEARGYEPGTSQACYLLAALTWWSEPIEHAGHVLQRAREGLIAGGDLTYAGYTYSIGLPYLVDSAQLVETWVAEVDAGLALVHRTGNG